MAEPARSKIDWIATGGLAITLIGAIIAFARWTAALENKVDRLEDSVVTVSKQVEQAKANTKDEICRDLTREIAQAYNNGYPGSVAEPLEKLLERYRCVAPIPRPNT